jgi:uncharacterized protein
MSATHQGTQKYFLSGPAGQIEALVDLPDGDIAGAAVITHPHPLLGGTADHKIPR